MVEIKVNLGFFEISLEQLLGLSEGQHFQFSVTPGQILDLFVGEEKIAEAKLLCVKEVYYLEISKMIFRN